MELSEFVDGECDAATATRVRAHLLECAACRDSESRWRAAGAAMRESDTTKNESPRFVASVRQAFAAANAPSAESLQKSLQKSTIPMRRPRSGFAVLAVAAAVIVSSVLFFSRASADDDIRAILELESSNRAEAMTQRARIESVKLEIASLRQRARVARMNHASRTAVNEEAQRLLDRAEGLEKRLASVEASLAREGIFNKNGEASTGR